MADSALPDFPTPSYDDWRRAAEKALRGKPFESLTWKTDDGFEIAAFEGPVESDVPTPAGGTPLTCYSVYALGDTNDVADRIEHTLGHGFDLVLLGAHGASIEIRDRAQTSSVLIEAPYSGENDAAWAASAVRGGVAGLVFGGALDCNSAAIQLADTFCHVVWFLRGRERGAHGLSPDDLARALVLPVSLGPDVVAATSKLRAARALWPRVAASAGVSPAAAAATRLLACRSSYCDTRFEPENNLIRATLSLFTGLCAGADIVLLDSYGGGDDDCATAQLALHQAHLMIEESLLTAVSDPFAGAPAIGALTNRLFDLSVAHLRTLEEGGWNRERDDGPSFRDLLPVMQQAERHYDDIVTRRRVIVGVNRFAAPGRDTEIESMHPEEFEWHYAEDGQDEAGCHLGVLLVASDCFDLLRDRVLGHVAAGERRPVALVVAAGNPKAVRPQAAFAADFLRCGGFDVEVPDPGATPSDATALLRGRVFDALVICGDDDVTTAIEAATDMPFYRVGKSGSDSDRVITRLHEGVDAVAILADALDRACVPRVPLPVHEDDVDGEEFLADVANLGEWD